MINVAVLEDNLVLQDRLVAVLEAWDFVSTVFGASTNRGLKELITSHDIDVLLADLSLPDGSGLQSIKAYSDQKPNGIAIVVSSRLDRESIISAIRAGAIGYLHKNDTSIGIIGALKLALAGESPISPAIAIKILDQIKEEHVLTIPADDTSPNIDILTKRELDVLRTISMGHSYAEASAILGISSKTLPVHVRKIYLKLQTKNRSEAVFKARRLGILD